MFIFATVLMWVRPIYGLIRTFSARKIRPWDISNMELKRVETEDFVARINRKEPAAWEELYLRYYKALCSYSASITGCRTASEDLVQEVLLKLWQSENSFALPVQLSTYLYRAVYRNSLAHRRDSSNREHLLRNMHEQGLNEGSFPSHEDPEEESEHLAEMVGEEVIRRLYNDIHRLPTEQRRIIKLSIEGFKGAEIARLLGISINTVKTQKYRGYRSLRLRLSKFVLVGLLATFFF